MPGTVRGSNDKRVIEEMWEGRFESFHTRSETVHAILRCFHVTP